LQKTASLVDGKRRSGVQILDMGSRKERKRSRTYLHDNQFARQEGDWITGERKPYLWLEKVLKKKAKVKQERFIKN